MRLAPTVGIGDDGFEVGLTLRREALFEFNGATFAEAN